MKTPEEYFVMGADAMQSRIAAFLVAQGKIDLAPKILALSLPKFSEPEQFVIDKTKNE